MKCIQIQELNISDSSMGSDSILTTIKAFRDSYNNSLRIFSCNYNDVNEREVAEKCLEILIKFKSIK